MTGRDAGTTIPLVLLCFLLAGTFTTASIAVSAAFLAHRDLAGICDGAAVAAAHAVDREALGGGTDSLPLDPAAVAETADRYRREVGRGVRLTATTEGRTVTVTCRRTVRVPFGVVLGQPDGLERTAVSRARSPLLPTAATRRST